LSVFRALGVRIAVLDFILDSSGTFGQNKISKLLALIEFICRVSLVQQQNPGEMISTLNLEYHGHAIRVIGVAKAPEDEEDFSLVPLDSAISLRSIKAKSSRPPTHRLQLYGLNEKSL